MARKPKLKLYIGARAKTREAVEEVLALLMADVDGRLTKLLSKPVQKNAELIGSRTYRLEAPPPNHRSGLGSPENPPEMRAGSKGRALWQELEGSALAIISPDFSGFSAAVST